MSEQKGITSGADMMKMVLFLSADALPTELAQAAEEGRDVTGFDEKVAEVLKIEGNAAREAAAYKLYDEIQQLPIRADYPHSTAETLEEIMAERCGHEQYKKDLAEIDGIEDKVLAGWLGRAAGCLLGKPVEGWMRDRIVGLAKDTANYPIAKYFRSDIGEELRQRYGVSDHMAIKIYGDDTVAWLNNVHCSPVDDDTNYTIMGLKVMEQYGKDFTPFDVGFCWMDSVPGFHCMTAERVGYRNLMSGIFPPESGTRGNPYREWIGAQIRADAYGYACPGNPEKAAKMAWADAVVAQARNGVYGEMFVAAMLAWAYCAKTPLEIVNAGLSQVPQNSRLHKAVSKVIGWYKDGLDVQEAIKKIHEEWNEANMHHWCHVVPNAMIVALGVLYGEGDYSKSISIAVESAFDTDCNGATVGSILGIFLGTAGIDTYWTDPLNNKVLSTINYNAECEFTDLAKRTVSIIYK